MSIIYRPKGRAGEDAHLAINHYIGCGHGCKYCYGPKVMHNPDFHIKPRPRKNVLEELKKQAPKFTGANERVLLSFACDPYQPIDAELGLTRDVICVLVNNKIPFQILTKGGMWAARDFDLYTDNDMFAATLTFINDGQSLQTEPNAAVPYERLQALESAHEKGIKTWVSLEPVIDAAQSLKLIEKTASFVNHYIIGILNYLPSDINWRQFGIEAIKLCEVLGKSYYIKHDLAVHLKGVEFTQTDLRKVFRHKDTKARSLF